MFVCDGGFFLNLKGARLAADVNHQEAINAITDYMVSFYNSQRLHSALDYRSPNGYEREMAANNLFQCPKKLDHYKIQSVVAARITLEF